MKLYKYSVPCITCGTSYELWIPENNEILCPVDSTHTIDEDNIIILQKRSMGELRDEHDKLEVISDSKPPNYFTVFTSVGDSATEIGGGQNLFWDWSNTDNVETTSAPGMKLKRMKLSFLDEIYIKEGAIYFGETMKGSYSRLRVICPAGNYYLDHNGVPQVATSDVTIVDYIPKIFMFGTCPMGDEQNTESCSRDVLPKNYQLWLDVHVPTNDMVSYGHVSLELYRARTCLLPGEPV